MLLAGHAGGRGRGRGVKRGAAASLLASHGLCFARALDLELQEELVESEARLKQWNR